MADESTGRGNTGVLIVAAIAGAAIAVLAFAGPARVGATVGLGPCRDAAETVGAQQHRIRMAELALETAELTLRAAELSRDVASGTSALRKKQEYESALERLRVQEANCF